MRSGTRTTSDGTALAGLVALAFAAVIMGGLFLGYRDVDVWGAFVVPLLLFGVTAPAVLAGERRRASGLGNLFILGLALTFVASYVYYLITFHYYPGGDAGRYHDVGSSIAEDFWAGRLGVADLVPTGRGTEFIDQTTGVVEVVVGRSLLAAQMVFAWLKFLGVLLFIKAARRGVPGLLDGRYATMMLFMPSVLYWPSALGKDAWMLFMLGLTAYGASLVFDRRLHGWALAALGIYGCLLVRPHLALILAGALAVAYVTSTRAGHRSSLGPVARVLGAGVLIIGLSFALSATSDLLPTFSPSDPLGTAGDALDSVQNRTSTGGSEFDAARANSVLTYPYAVITVLLRPLPFEASSLPTLLASLESLLLVGLFWKWRRNVAVAFGSLRTSAYMRFALLYAALFTFAWSSVSNLGIIARQRVQVLPFLLLLLAVGARSTSASSESEASAAESDAVRDTR